MVILVVVSHGDVKSWLVMVRFSNGDVLVVVSHVDVLSWLVMVRFSCGKSW